MTSPSSPFNLKFMERRKASRTSIDELAIVKAAACAWYQRGSGYEGRSMLEFNLTRPSRAPKPSRYKLEAMKEAQEAAMVLDEFTRSPYPAPIPTHTDSSSLFDTYEINRISKDLDYYMKSSHTSYFGGGGGGYRRIMSVLEDDNSGVSSVKSKNKTKKINGFFWFKHAAVLCGSRDEVVHSTTFRGSGRRKNILR